jgi:hypothetical protein
MAVKTSQETEAQTERQDARFNTQEWGQLHRLFHQLHYHISWRESDETSPGDDYQYNMFNADWSHVVEDGEGYNPDFDEYRQTGVPPFDFISPKEEIKEAALELIGSMAGELRDEPQTSLGEFADGGVPDSQQAQAAEQQAVTDGGQTDTQTDSQTQTQTTCEDGKSQATFGGFA